MALYAPRARPLQSALGASARAVSPAVTGGAQSPDVDLRQAFVRSSPRKGPETGDADVTSVRVSIMRPVL